MPKLVFLFNFNILIIIISFFLTIFYFQSFVNGGLIFEWIPSNQLLSEYWLNKNNCDDNNKNINNNNNASYVGILNGEIKVNNLLFPENGIIFFGENSKIVEEFDKQCLKELVNNPKIDLLPNFFDVQLENKEKFE
ncbi:hypothetical protein Mgra_00009119 [Meloidogyne graminicola]|uniref:Uncharacterized protein n=1 Tax=Meloidogyne graminicola TaxID=189291 RepID=A0A8S9ZDX9_9BILA|nr:hypothetical protein Mgra_00009119 [Meloidogyne graminicola]